MSLMKMREQIRVNAASSWRAREARVPASLGQIRVQFAIAALLGIGGFLMLISGNESAGTSGLMTGGFFALVADINRRRLRDAQDAELLLPERILCPSCEASLVLSLEERDSGRFACNTCGKDFEVSRATE